MTLQASGQISLSDIATELGWGGTQDSMDTFTAQAIGDTTITNTPDHFSDWYGYQHAQVPDPPTGVSLAERGDNDHMDLTWTDPNGGAKQEDHYRIEYDVDGGGFNFVVNSAQDSEAYGHSILSCPADTGKDFKYRIRAENGAGNSSWVESNTVNIACA